MDDVDEEDADEGDWTFVAPTTAGTEVVEPPLAIHVSSANRKIS